MKNLANEYEYKVRFDASNGLLFGSMSSGIQFRIDEDSLARSFCPLPVRCADLYRIAMSVYAADRLSPRRSSGSGDRRARTLRLNIEVSQLAFWRSAETRGLLQAALAQLSDDRWQFEFSATNPRQSQLCLSFPDRPIVCLYSGGLDSAAGLATRLRNGCSSVLAVTARHQPGQRAHVGNQLSILRDHFRADLHSVMVKSALRNSPRWSEQEPSQRCRSFLFASLGGCVACAANTSEVEVYENGVGVVNLPMMQGMLVGARTTRSCHPFFLRCMGDLVSRVAGRRIRFVLPFRERTKAELVRALCGAHLERVVAETVSCVRYPLRVKGSGKQCGYCAGCIGRRQALQAGGVRDDSDSYHVDLFGRGDQVNQVPQRHLRYLKATLKQVADFAVLGNRSSCPLPSLFRRHLFGTKVIQACETPDKIIDLLLRYEKEWHAILAVGRKRGWGWASWLPASYAA